MDELPVTLRDDLVPLLLGVVVVFSALNSRLLLLDRETRVLGQCDDGMLDVVVVFRPAVTRKRSSAEGESERVAWVPATWD